MLGRTTTALAATALALTTLLGAAPSALAASGYEKGPDPTRASVEAKAGPFAVSTSTVSRTTAKTFGGGTVYYPTDASIGTVGAVAVSPGYTARQSSVAWLGPRIASQGFVVITIDTLSVYDKPAARGDQLRAALRYLTTSSAVKDRIDPTRLAVAGHSMGGGGALEAVKDDPSLRAAVPLTPWNTDTTWPEVTTPTLVIGAQNDDVAPPYRHARLFYGSVPSSTPKEYLELRGASHYAPTSVNSTNPTVASYTISWLKRFVDGDTRYSQFLCPAPAVGTTFNVVRSTCPF
ncbi:alpha/beta hydrolase fold domain-containing protein [Streptomyces sp. NP160]|uniref:alpha/beta hydrolase family protein n=1 Tax=Streptomyces sp. NP160 TaxID=2586637 RepID=UPI00214C3760|nr:alpha/beta hydrolase fold domain-containing protein [Streptomyces sp. NP160]